MSLCDFLKPLLEPKEYEIYKYKFGLDRTDRPVCQIPYIHLSIEEWELAEARLKFYVLMYDASLEDAELSLYRWVNLARTIPALGEEKGKGQEAGRRDCNQHEAGNLL